MCLCFVCKRLFLCYNKIILHNGVEKFSCNACENSDSMFTRQKSFPHLTSVFTDNFQCFMIKEFPPVNCASLILVHSFKLEITYICKCKLRSTYSDLSLEFIGPANCQQECNLTLNWLLTAIIYRINLNCFQKNKSGSFFITKK